jgi:hypothetical protein
LSNALSHSDGAVTEIEGIPTSSVVEFKLDLRGKSASQQIFLQNEETNKMG